jgi:hydroxyacylglutathione hydrolase
LGAVPSTTLGYEKLFNPAFQIESEDEFVRWLLAGQPEPPRYFARMKVVNRVGPALLASLPKSAGCPARTQRGCPREALVIDARHGRLRARPSSPARSVPGTSSHFSTYAGWFVDYEQPTYLVADEGEAPRLLRELRAIGVDDIPGYFTPEDALAGAQLETTPQIDPREAAGLHPDAALLLDVRGANEYQEAHIPGARHIPMGYVLRHLDQLPRAGRIVVQCGSGARALLVASLLQKHGYTDVLNLRGGIDAWRRARLPVEKG